MDFERIMIRYMERLLNGDRLGCRQILGEALQTGTPANVVYTSLFWPVMTEVEKLYRNNHINRITEQMATRINRTLVDQLQSKLPRQESAAPISIYSGENMRPPTPSSLGMNSVE